MRVLLSLSCTAALLALATTAVRAQSLPMQRVSTVSTAARHGGIDGPFLPKPQSTAEPAAADSIGDTLESQAQQRISSTLGANGALAHRNAITRQQAQAQGLGFVATHFEQIDRSHSGRVTLEDVQAYVKQQQR
ncbi:hypothetical protein [Xanthomonas cannabis]|uniref:hypothetical protein n=1 Tax=Xanthomonas cannabis TaxID=1885674 RepID=UPI00141B3931|nr:hypothetical protein [Xanthomonas cannabis]NIK02377.1 hypothetical protein [Xanthomonas cannabis]